MMLAFAGQKGGVGKSTIAISCACELMVRGRQVLLVDADHEQGTTRIFGETAVEHGHEAPTVVAMGTAMTGADQLRRLAGSYDDVVIDCPPRNTPILRAALMTADLAILPVGPSTTEIWALGSTADLVEQAQSVRADLQARVLINRKDARTVLGRRVRENLETTLRLPLLATEISYLIAHQEAPAAGQGVTTYASKDRAAAEMRALVDEIIALIAERKNPAKKTRTKTETRAGATP